MPARKDNELVDALYSFEAGMNNGVSPLLLPHNQMAYAENLTVRGTFAKPRPPFRKIALSFSDATAAEGFTQSLWQGAGYFKPDNANGMLVASIAGRLFELDISGTTAAVTEFTIAGDPNSATADQAWLWQSEKWLIANDAVNAPVFYDGTTATRSTNTGTLSSYSTTTAADFAVPAIGDLTGVAITMTAVADMIEGDILKIEDSGEYIIKSFAGAVATCVNLNAVPQGETVLSGATVTWWHRASTQLPPGRMGVYGMGRNWVCLPDARQFIASDIVGSSSGTQANSYRDSVLNVTENAFLAGGGNFIVPGNVGDIQAMKFVATLDASLGQGPLQVLTPNTVFSCNAPVDRGEWQDIQNPILTISQITNGGVSQNSTVLANGDLLFRSQDGIRSLILGRRDFNTWGNVPISREVEEILSGDDETMLRFGSAVVFDNRMLMTASPVATDYGNYFTKIVALNFDPISSLRGKAPSVYDGIWTGINVLQLVVGDFAGEERAFAFTFNTTTESIELYELLPSSTSLRCDNSTTPLTWTFESSSLDFGKRDPRNRTTLRLADGEIHIDDLKGRVNFWVFYKPDQYPCWTLWHSWSECATMSSDTSKPQFRPSMGLGEPSGIPCDTSTDRPMREGKTFQFKIVIQGHCRFLSAYFRAIDVGEAKYSQPNCNPPCLNMAVMSAACSDTMEAS